MRALVVIPEFWLLDQDPLALDRWLRVLRYRRFGVSNTLEISQAELRHQDAARVFIGEDVPVPDNFPAPRLALPKRGFAPDYFMFGLMRFCSRRFREAVAQPAGVVQWTDVNVVYGGPAVLRRDYKLLRALAHRPAMDLERSECRLEHLTHPKTGEQRILAFPVQRFALVAGLAPRTDIFRIDESMGDVLVTDALAERILQAGCTGMDFIDPECPQRGQRIARYRTVTGVSERRVHF